MLKAALEAAKAKGVRVSVDLNYRKKLWTPAEAQACMSDLMRYVDVCIGNEEDAEKCLGFKPEGTDVKTGALDISGYEKVFRGMKEKFGFSYIATSRGNLTPPATTAGARSSTTAGNFTVPAATISASWTGWAAAIRFPPD